MDITTNKCCGNCKFQEKNECHRYPPTLYGSGQENEDSSGFPFVRETDWCGEYISKSEFGCLIPVVFYKEEGIKTIHAEKKYDENLNEI